MCGVPTAERSPLARARAQAPKRLFRPQPEDDALEHCPTAIDKLVARYVDQPVYARPTQERAVRAKSMPWRTSEPRLSGFGPA